MIQEKLLSVSDLAKELDIGKATIKFLLKRFKNWIPNDLMDGQPYYSNETIKIIFFIQEQIEMGVLPSKIETQLDTLKSQNLPKNEDITIGKDGLEFIKSLCSDIGAQQERIANAHEKRALVEERKAVAIEKRAVAEEKKALAMNNIADALQEMNQHRPLDANVQQIAHETASMIASDESGQEDTSVSDTTPNSDTLNEIDTDLSSLLDEDNMLEEFTADDDLSEMLDQELDDTHADHDIQLDDPLDLDDLSTLIDEDANDLDDLSLLLDKTPENEDPIESAISEQLDDLSQLLDTKMEDDFNDNEIKKNESPVLDDLSALIEPALGESALGESESIKSPSIESFGELDDLSKLIDISTDNSTGNLSGMEQAMPDLDDLSKLIDNSSSKNQVETKLEDIPALDDLSALIDQPVQMDDLSKLIDEPKVIEKPKDLPLIKIDISPENDLKKYKAAVMKIIIGLKSDNLTAQEATDRLNDNKIKTLSGKPEWTSKAILQIYKFIDSAQ